MKKPLIIFFALIALAILYAALFPQEYFISQGINPPNPNGEPWQAERCFGITRKVPFATFDAADRVCHGFVFR